MKYHARKLLLALFCASVAAADEQAWKMLAMSGGVALQYPGSWWAISADKDRLDILSSKTAGEAGAIQKNQAQIIVSTATQSAGTSFDQLIARNVGRQIVLSTEELPATAPHGCLRLQKVVSAEETGAANHVSDTRMLCDTGLTGVVVLLRNWQADEQQRQFEAVALRIARSIRRTQ